MSSPFEDRSKIHSPVEGTEMRTAVIILGALVATAFAAPDGMPKMPNLNMLNNLKSQMPQIPPGMKLDDLKDAFHNMPSSMKDRLSDMAKSFGMELDDVEDALNNPPQQLKDIFEGNADTGAKNDGTFKVPTTDDEATVETDEEAPKMPNLGGLGGMADMLKNVDINSMMKNMDLGPMGEMMKGMDIGAMMKNIDMGAVSEMMKNVDMGAIQNVMQNMDMGAMGDIMKNMDMGAMGNIMQNMDMGAMGNIMKNMDMGAMGNIMKNMDMGAMGNIMKNMDMGAIGNIMKNVDMGNIMQNMDMGAMGNIMKNMDMGAMGDMMKNMGPMADMLKHVDLKNVMGMVGIPENASPVEILGTIKDKVKDIASNPMETLQWAKEKLANLKLPEGMEITDLLNMAHGQLEAMGIPADPEKIKEMLGLEGLKMEDLKDPQAIAEVLRKKAFRMLGLDENEDPMTIKKRIEEQLMEEANKLGANLSPDSTPEQVKEELDKAMSKELKNIGLEVESVTPNGLHKAVKQAMSGMGFPMHDLGALKHHVMKMVMQKLMAKVTPMIINLFMPHPRPQRPPMPPMMQARPPMMQARPPMMPLDLNIEVNVDQPPQRFIPVPMPGYLRGAEVALHHDIQSFESDEMVYHHIMAVREALRTGEMPDEALEEMIEDLMNARLKARVLSVKNMFLKDRLTAMEREMDMMTRPAVPMPMRMPVPQQAPRTSSIRESPILRALKGLKME